MKKTEYQQDIISRIRNMRIDKGYSQQKVAVLLDISSGQVGNIESANQPHKYTLAQIKRQCEEFGLSINYIFTSKETCPQDELIEAIVKYEEGK